MVAKLLDIPPRMDEPRMGNPRLRVIVGTINRDHYLVAGAPVAVPGVDRLIIPAGHATDRLLSLRQSPLRNAAFKDDI